MSQVVDLVDILKKQLKAAGKTYADVADCLEISEASVKRLFSRCDFSLHRLQRVCQLIKLDLVDLMRLIERRRPAISQLTEAQEQQIIADEKLMLVLICVLSHWSLEDILHYYSLTKVECIGYLIKLDELGIIELLPNNYIKLLIAPNFDWIAHGPIQMFFQQHMQHDFLSSPFQQKNELFLCKSGMLTPESSQVLQHDMRTLADKFLALNQEAASVPLESRDGAALVIALRSWVPEIFDKYR